MKWYAPNVEQSEAGGAVTKGIDAVLAREKNGGWAYFDWDKPIEGARMLRPFFISTSVQW